MKKNPFYLFLLLLIMSCQGNDRIDIETIDIVSEVDPEIEAEFKSFTNSKVGLVEDDKLIFKVSKESIVREFKKFSEKNHLNLKFNHFSNIKIEGKNYLRFYGEDNMVSTVALIKGKNNRLIIGETVCTSELCATGGGCIPDGVYCTKCQPPGTNPPVKGDCKRSTSGGGEDL